MSLIDEALKRARQEAALQDAAQREAQFRRVPVYAPPPPRSRGGLAMAGLGLGLGIVLALGLAFAAGWIPGRQDTPEPVRQEARAEVTTAPATPRIVEEAVVEETAAPVEVPQETPRQAPPPAPAPPPVRAEAPAVAEAPAAPEPEPEPEPELEPEPEPVPAAPLSYVRQVPVPGGGTLELSGIAFSAERPVALINGKPWVPGESVEGFTVVAVEPGGVQLEGHGRKVFVSLK